MSSSAWQAKLFLAAMAALATMFLLSSCAPPVPPQSRSLRASLGKDLILETSDNPRPIIIPFPPNGGSARANSRSGPFGSTTDAETTAAAPVADVVAFYKEKLAAQRPRITVRGQETQFKWRDQNTKLTLTLTPVTGGAGTVVKVHAQE